MGFTLLRAATLATLDDKQLVELIAVHEGVMITSTPHK